MATPGAEGAPRPAGFWRRYAAWSLDAAALAVPVFAILHARAMAATAQLDAAFAGIARVFVRALDGVVLDGLTARASALRLFADPAAVRAIDALQSAVSGLVLLPALVIAVLLLPWHAGFERSAWQGSPGKRALRLRVTDARGARIGLLRSVARHVAGIASWLTLNLGHLLAAVPPRHLAMHDQLSGTRVVRKGDGPRLPAWALAWIALQAAALVAAIAWLAARLDAALQAALAI